MKGDFTRLRFDARKHYDSVLMQQGRVQTDADWNEQAQIAEHRDRTAAMDTVGSTGAPQDHVSHGRGSFLVYREVDPEGVARLFVNGGRYYASGLLVESEAPVLYDPPLAEAGGAGVYLLHLDIWKRHITGVEDPDLREAALTGMDSSSRSQVTWQVRLERLGDLDMDVFDVDARQYGPPWQPPALASTGALDVRLRRKPGENQLYRVEVHRAGTSDTASFKWSRDNGCVVERVLGHTPPVEDQGAWTVIVTLDGGGKDRISDFAAGHMVELSCEELSLRRRPGIFAQVTRAAGNKLELAVSKDPTEALGGTGPTVRRWDNSWNPDLPGVTLENVGPDHTQGDRVLLEQELTVRFGRGPGHRYQVGDYWLIPVRTASGLEQWKEGQPQTAAGEAHWYAPLAAVKFQADGSIGNPTLDLRDLRDVFPTLRSLVDGVGTIAQGTGEKNVLPRWQSSGGSMLVGSNVSDDGSQVAIGVPLRVGNSSDSAPISRFTSSSIQAMPAADLPATVPTSQGVKQLVEWAVPAGTVVAYASETVPSGWLECNGFQYTGMPGSIYGRLFDAIGKTFGAGNGSPYGFNVPDLRGTFIRGWDHGRSRDPDRGARSGGDHVGSTQGDQFAEHGHSFSGGISINSAYTDHNHAYIRPTHGMLPWAVAGDAWCGEYTTGTGGMSAYTSHSHSGSVSGSADANGGSESRPKNTYLMYIIKY